VRLADRASMRARTLAMPRSVQVMLAHDSVHRPQSGRSCPPCRQAAVASRQTRVNSSPWWMFSAGLANRIPAWALLVTVSVCR
jgi:hypothetical protein